MPVLFEGWLFKRPVSARVGKWQRRWLVLGGGSLRWYADSEGARGKPKGSMGLGVETELVLNPSGELTVTDGRRHLVLRASAGTLRRSLGMVSQASRLQQIGRDREVIEGWRVAVASHALNVALACDGEVRPEEVEGGVDYDEEDDDGEDDEASTGDNE